MHSIEEKIQAASLTKTQTLIANYLKTSISEACFLTSTEIARKIGVSEASIIRFCRAIGFHGFIDFQKHLKEEYQQSMLSISSSITVPAKRLHSSIHTESFEESIQKHHKHVLDNLEEAFQCNHTSAYAKAAHILSGSRRKYIAASRANTCLANYAHLYLKQMIPLVENTASTAMSPFDHMCRISKEDCLLIFSFPRYSTLDKITVDLALQAGASIILITDRLEADLAPYASVVLVSPINSNLFFNSFVGVQFVLETLLNILSKEVKGLEKRLKKIDHYLEQMGTY